MDSSVVAEVELAVGDAAADERYSRAAVVGGGEVEVPVAGGGDDAAQEIKGQRELPTLW